MLTLLGTKAVCRHLKCMTGSEVFGCNERIIRTKIGGRIAIFVRVIKNSYIFIFCVNIISTEYFVAACYISLLLGLFLDMRRA